MTLKRPKIVQRFFVTQVVGGIREDKGH